MRFLKSFRYAFRGIVYCINTERNMRIHTVIALYVFVFSFFFHLTRVEYAVLFLAFAQVKSFLILMRQVLIRFYVLSRIWLPAQF